MTRTAAARPETITTDGSIAVNNLNAQIEGSAALINRVLTAYEGPQPDNSLFAQRVVSLIDLLLLRGHISGRIADYEQACDLGDMLVRVSPQNPVARLARARTRATLHKFADAVSDLDLAERLGANERELTGERIGIFQVLGRYEEAERLLQGTRQLHDKAAATGHLAVIRAECGQTDEADSLFQQARRSYRGSSPFPLAQIDFQRGKIWHREGALRTAELCYEDALRLIPQYAPALGHLAEIELHLGNSQAAAARLRPLTETSDDPEYAGLLATALANCNIHGEAQTWRGRAASRYDELVWRHPEAYAHHAAHFWLTEGADPDRGLQLAQQNLEFSQTPRARALHERAIAARAKRASPSSSVAPARGDLAASSQHDRRENPDQISAQINMPPVDGRQKGVL